MLYIMRHGKTSWNEQYKLQGRTDVPLNELGISQAKKSGEESRNINFDICFCSPLIRARVTAETFLEGRDVPIVIDDRLSEMCFGEYEGTSRIYQHPELNVYKFFKDTANYVADKGAESMDELYARTGEFLKEKVFPLLYENKDVLIVGHGAMNTSIICQLRNTPLKNFWSEGIENCKLIRLIDTLSEVKDVWEDDYGCEERDPNAEEMLILNLKDSVRVKVPAALVDKLDIKAGDTVAVCDGKVISKIN